MSSAFVPTLSTSIPSSHRDIIDGRQEVTTLVFKPPKRIPVWNSPAKSYASIEDPPQTPPEGSGSSDSLRLMSNAGASVGMEPTVPAVNAAEPPEGEQPELHLRFRRPAAARPTSRASMSALIGPSHSHPSPNRAPSPQRSRKTYRHDAYRHSQPVGGGVGIRRLSTDLDPPPTPRFMKTVQRPAWQVGGGTARRASSPVVVTGSSLPHGHGVTLSHNPNEGDDPVDIDPRTTYIRIYTPESHPSQGTRRDQQRALRTSFASSFAFDPELQIEPEPRLTTHTGSAFPLPSPKKMARI
ncbi:hypothetical protein JB92DRAFT_2934627, partial [Gautieria morchelliformis]